MSMHLEMELCDFSVVGFDVACQRRTCVATNIQRFRAAYGVGPGACSAVYRDLQTTSVPDARQDQETSRIAIHATRVLPVSSESVQRPHPAGAPCSSRAIVLVGEDTYGPKMNATKR